MNRKQTVESFRARVLELIDRNKESRSAFAARVGMDRSTLSQLLSADNDRLPRAERVVAIARAEQVSCDWLLGLTQDRQEGTELIRAGMEIESGAGSPMDERLARWHKEATGYKIRYIPTTLPDLLKTEEVIRYECPDVSEAPLETSVGQISSRLSYSRQPETEMEVCCAAQTLESFARGESVWRGLERRARHAQIERMVELTDELYPTFRWSLYDGQSHFSVPVTVFGPQRAVVYVGELYFVFNMTDHIRVLAAHFDKLVREAVTQPTDMPDYLQELRRKVR
jgi:transcriptional regulator with XRE-family HTH domain